MAANNMAQKATKKEIVKNEESEAVPEPPPQPMEAKDVPILSQVRFLWLQFVTLGAFVLFLV